MLRPNENHSSDKSVTVTQRDGPLDMEHLSRQTLGDDTLAREVLGMFIEQTTGVEERLRLSKPRERRELAHALVGSARGIGAFDVADCAARIEREPVGCGEITRLSSLLREVNDFIAKMR